MMKRFCLALALLCAPSLAHGQQRVTIQQGTSPVSASNPLYTSATITPSGTQDVNLTKILGAAPSLTNYLWVFPATGATFPTSHAAGSVVPGSYLSGALASGAVVDLTALSAPITPATATGTKSILLGMQYNSTQATFTNTQQGTVQGTSRGALYVATGADAFTVALNATPTVAAGNGVISAPSSEALAAIAHSTSVTAAESCRVLKASAGNLYSLRVSIAATSGYVMVFDATSAPGDGAVTTLAIPAVRVVSDGTSGWYADDFNPPLRNATGITVCFSSTGPFSKTASATAAIAGQVQ